MKIFPGFAPAIKWVDQQMRDASQVVMGNRWQSTDVSEKPEMRMRECLNISFEVALAWDENIDNYRRAIEPNLPWADDHFEERVLGQPLNPGLEWRNWPWALAADKHRKAGGTDPQFSHTYMERYWPKVANKSAAFTDIVEHSGIRYKYGDLNDVVNHLLGDPLTRQAYLPVWFPEDTGVVHGERVPCSLGYHWIQRNGYFHSTYYIRSCDFYRHFRDDLYLTARLWIWVLHRLRELDETEFWKHIRIGLFTFHCVSMHCFINDWNRLYGTTK